MSFYWYRHLLVYHEFILLFFNFLKQNLTYNSVLVSIVQPSDLIFIYITKLSPQYIHYKPNFTEFILAFPL